MLLSAISSCLIWCVKVKKKGGPDEMRFGCTVSFVKILYDQLYLVDNRIAKNHHFMQGNNCVDTARGNPSRVKKCHEVAEAMF